MSLSNPEELKKVYHQMMKREAVYWSNFFPSNILEAIPGASQEDIHYSKPIMSIPMSFGFAKSKPSVVQRLYDNIGWINSFGLLNFYKKVTKQGRL